MAEAVVISQHKSGVFPKSRGICAIWTMDVLQDANLTHLSYIGLLSALRIPRRLNWRNIFFYRNFDNITVGVIFVDDHDQPPYWAVAANASRFDLRSLKHLHLKWIKAANGLSHGSQPLGIYYNRGMSDSVDSSESAPKSSTALSDLSLRFL